MRIRVREEVLDRLDVDYRSKSSLDCAKRLPAHMKRSESSEQHSGSNSDSDAEWTMIERCPRSEYRRQFGSQDTREDRRKRKTAMLAA